jgi:hypothetical protein
MAYGMLTSFALGAAQGLGGAIVNKLSKDQDAEIKAKADAEREARIEEATIRLEARKNERSDFEFDRLQSQKVIDSATERQAKFEDEDRKRREANDPNTLTGQKTVAEIADIKKRGMLTDTSMAEKEVETEQKQRLNSLQSDLVNAKTPEEKATIASTIQQLSGKQTEENRALSKIVVSPDGKSYLKIDGLYNTATGKEIWAENAVPANPKEVESKAVAYANLKAGTSLAHASEAPTLASKGWGDTGKENARKSEEFSKAYNEFKLNGGVAIEQDKKASVKAEDINKLYSDKVNIGGMRKPNSQEFEPSQGVAKDLHKMDHQLWLYGTGESKNVDKPLSTIRETISTWSPKSDKNDTDRLVAEASKLLNINPDAKIDLTDSTIRGQIMKAIVKQEHGGQIKGDINQIYQYIDNTYGSTPLQSKPKTSSKIISIEKVVTNG